MTMLRENTGGSRYEVRSTKYEVLKLGATWLREGRGGEQSRKAAAWWGSAGVEEELGVRRGKTGEENVRRGQREWRGGVSVVVRGATEGRGWQCVGGGREMTLLRENTRGTKYEVRSTKYEVFKLGATWLRRGRRKEQGRKDAKRGNQCTREDDTSVVRDARGCCGVMSIAAFVGEFLWRVCQSEGMGDASGSRKNNKHRVER